MMKKDKETTNVTVEELTRMESAEIRAFIDRFPYQSQYEHPSAFGWIEYHVALIRGRRYMATGNIKSLFTR